MSKLIFDEIEAAKKLRYSFKEIGGTRLVQLSRENVAIAEAMIMQDSRYNTGFEPVGKY